MAVDTLPNQEDPARSLPHDVDAERALLGACMRDPAAYQHLTERVTRDAFMWRDHQHIWDAIHALGERGAPIDPVTVTAELQDRGTLQQIWKNRATNTYILDCYSAGIAVASVDYYTRIVVSHYQRRRVIAALSTALQRAIEGVDDPNALAAVMDVLDNAIEGTYNLPGPTEAPIGGTWQPVDLTPILAGGLDEPPPTILARDDDARLMYPQRMHAVSGESESLKTWFMLIAALQEISVKHHVVYIDFEDSPTGIVHRMAALGATHDALTQYFHYIAPAEPFGPQAVHIVQHVLDLNPTLAVLDGITEAMELHGLDDHKNIEIAAFYRRLPRYLTRLGITVGMIDHVTKDPETRSRYAIGGQHKLAGIDGPHYRADPIKPFGRGLHGITRILVTKDRPGFVRAISGPPRQDRSQVVCDMHLTSHPDGSVEAELRPPRHTPVDKAADEPSAFRPTRIMEHVSRVLENSQGGLSGRAVEAAVKGKNDTVRLALELLVNDGHATQVARHGRGGGYMYTIKEPFRDNPEPGPQDVDSDDGF